jgi:putative component of toxin-antitoxin plasmid stabilization module
MDGDEVILLCGGDKSTQDADIARARQYWKDYKRRNRVWKSQRT